MVRDGVTALTMLFYALKINAWFFFSSSILLLMSPSWVTSLQIIGVVVAYQIEYMLGIALQSVLFLYVITTS